MTFSLAGRCDQTGNFGVVISSSSPAVAARCAHARAGVGAVCTQNITDPRLGPLLLRLIGEGLSARTAMSRVVREHANIQFRQLTVIDANGDTEVFNGTGVLGTHAAAQGTDCVAAGNLLSSERAPEQMVSAFEQMQGRELGDRLIAGLRAGLDSGGEEGPVHSAGMIIVTDQEWPVTDLRVDWSDDPIGQLEALWRLWRPQAAAYVQRAIAPGNAPTYGVPGDL
jgi:uncharacterized Ntn-hydrolase superfamily protein